VKILVRTALLFFFCCQPASGMSQEGLYHRLLTDLAAMIKVAHNAQGQQGRDLEQLVQEKAVSIVRQLAKDSADVRNQIMEAWASRVESTVLVKQLKSSILKKITLPINRLTLDLEKQVRLLRQKPTKGKLGQINNSIGNMADKLDALAATFAKVVKTTQAVIDLPTIMHDDRPNYTIGFMAVEGRVICSASVALQYPALCQQIEMVDQKRYHLWKASQELIRYVDTLLKQTEYWPLAFKALLRAAITARVQTVTAFNRALENQEETVQEYWHEMGNLRAISDRMAFLKQSLKLKYGNNAFALENDEPED